MKKYQDQKESEFSTKLITIDLLLLNICATMPPEQAQKILNLIKDFQVRMKAEQYESSEKKSEWKALLNQFAPYEVMLVRRCTGDSTLH